MKKFFQDRLQAHMSTILRLAPWLLLITVFLLFQYFLFLNAKAGKKEAMTAIHITKDRGASIIHAFEATLFASRGFTDEEIHNLLSEQANRTDIHFIVLMDKEGNILNSNDSSIIGENVMPFLSHAKNLGEINGVILDIKIEKGKKIKTFLVEKQLFVMHYFKEKRNTTRNPSDFPHRKYNPLNQDEEQTNLEDRFLNNTSAEGVILQQHNPPHLPYNDSLEVLTYYDIENPQPFPHPTMFHPRRHFMEKNPLYMLIAFDMKEIENAQKQDNALGQIYTIGSFFLIILSVFSFFILRAYQRSYRFAQQSKDYILSLMHALPLGIIAIDHNNMIQTMNQEAEELTKSTEKNVKGQDILSLIPQLASSDLSSLKNKTITLYAHSENASTVEINTFPILDTQNKHNKPHGMGIILRDLQEIQKLQEEIHRQERLASVGRLAAGIAHEIRNPLGTIKGIARLFEEKALRSKENSISYSEDTKILEGKDTRNNEKYDNEVKLASIMTQEITRVDKVISDLLELSKPNTINPKDTNIKTLLEKAKNSVFSSAKNIEFFENIAGNCTHAFLDEDRMIQVFHNIFLNAIQAMDTSFCTSTPHKITVSIRRNDEQQKLLTQNKMNNFQSNIHTSTMEIRITDTGKGIAEEDIKNLFTPYYTSKAQGTGLGLVMVQKIVQAHNGTVRLESELGKGTSVIINLIP